MKNIVMLLLLSISLTFYGTNGIDSCRIYTDYSINSIYMSLFTDGRLDSMPYQEWSVKYPVGGKVSFIGLIKRQGNEELSKNFGVQINI